MSRRYRGRSQYRSHGSSGRDRALQHIEEAKQLSAELGGTDRDVKSYFFSLSPSQLAPILEEYGDRYGEKAREYALETLPAWRASKVQMSGMVASRLFNLLPPRMPVSAKYALAENLWHHMGPSSHRSLTVGLDASMDDIVETVQAHIDTVVVEFQLPVGLQNRFEWLADGDIAVKQQILNHLRGIERTLVVEGVRTRVPVLLNHLRSGENPMTHGLREILKIGKHQVDVVLDTKATGVTLGPPAVSTPTVTSALARPTQGPIAAGWWWVVFAIFLLWLLTRN